MGRNTRKPVAAANAMPRAMGKATSDTWALSQPSTVSTFAAGCYPKSALKIMRFVLVVWAMIAPRIEQT
jgi:hypothetical protein